MRNHVPTTPAELSPPAVTRKGSTPTKVYVLPEELATIQAAADTVGLSASTYLRNLGLGFKPRSVQILPHKAQIGTQTYTRKRWTLRQMKTPAPIESIVRDQLFKPT